MGAALWHALGSDMSWTPEAHLTAAAVDAINAGNWQRGGDKNAPRPAPLQRPAEVHAAQQAAERHATRAARFLARRQTEEE